MSLRRKAPMKRGPGPKRGGSLARGGRVKPANWARRKRKRLEGFGSGARAKWWRRQPCVCGGRHPACSGGWSDPSHIISRGAGGTASDIVPMSRGCHDAWHAHGRYTYCRALGIVLTHLINLAAYYATKGPDRPGDTPT